MLDAMLVLSLTVALTCFFFLALFKKGCLPALLVLLLPLLPIIIIVVVGICKAIYGLHGILGIIALVFVAFVVLTPITFVIGIFLDIDYGIDIFKWGRRNTKPLAKNKGYTKPNITKVTHIRRKPNEQNWYPYKKPKY